MATKTKDSSVVGKEKKAISSNSPIASTKKGTTATTKGSTTNKPTSGPSEKQLPNYLKPTISSVHLDSRSFRLPRNNNDAATKPTLNRRRSFDPSSSRVPKQTPPSLSRQQKALVSPGPRDRTLTHRSSSVPSKVITNNNASKPLPERLSKTPKEGRRTQPLVAKSTKKGSNNVSASSTKKVITDDASTNSTKAGSKSTSVGETETTNDVSVETEPQVKEAINEDVVGEVDKVENQEELTRQVVDSEHDHEVHDQKLEESDERHEGKVIPTLSEEQQEDGNRKQDESSHVENDHSTAEAEDEVKDEGEVEIEEDHKDESNNEGTVVEEKERSVEEGISEEVNNKLRERGEEDEQVEKGEGDEKDEQVENEVKEEKGEPTKVEQVKASEEVEEEKESPSQISNVVIEETAGRLLEERRNRVRALAGAFQTVIDHQTK
ncbi:hypothetical protein Fmac_000843 [Flemingia macrophylla]|uniref:Calmodulin-binding domain-containing protein n=1 Tax=Flemingia macrophylla TaxID=520843 RepID=A0ABD1NFD1_9FABA